MIDIVFPKGNEHEFIRVAERLGMEGLCFAYTTPQDIAKFQKDTKLKLCSAILCQPADVRKYKAKHLTIVRAPEKPEELRKVIEQHRPHILFGLEQQRRSDFIHHRASGLNHVLAVLAKEKGVCIALSFSDILRARPWQRQLILGRMMQNIKLARKFKFDICFASFAGSPYGMRSVNDLHSFFGCLGMPEGNTGKAVGWKT